MALSFPDGIKERKKVGEGKRKERGTREREEGGREQGREEERLASEHLLLS